MAGSKIESNMFLINAPAGSGKTHFIKDKINDIIEKTPSARILCITYTERAAKELKSRILSEEVFISTIHSFINFFITPYYAHSEAINLYYNLYKSDVEKRIQENKTLEINDPLNRNSKYLLSKGLEASLDISLQLIKENTKSIYYNEKNYNTFYYGGLSHDNLLEFAFAFLEKYPVLQFRLREMFQYIFVDEVQDTDTKILHLFYNAVKDTTTQLYYFGDKMQEIYENYDGGFEVEYKNFGTSLSKEFKYNYRSSEEIVNVLNNLYGRKGSDRQKSKAGRKNIFPQLIVCKSIDRYYIENISDFSEFLVLRIANRARFARINQSESMENVFNAISNIYPQGSKLSPIDVMLPPKGERSPDILVEFFYSFAKIKEAFDNRHYAEVIQLLNSQLFVALDGRKKLVFHSSMKVSEHVDKVRLQTTLKEAFEKYSFDSKYNLEEFLDYLAVQNIIVCDFIEHVHHIENDNGMAVYQQLLANGLSEMKRLINYKDNQSISTQHGVKGEGYPKVCFWGEDSKSNRPFVYMYDFFKLYTQLDNFDLKSFQDFYYEFKSSINELEKNLEIRISNLKSPNITEENIYLLDEILNKFEGNIYFDEIFKGTRNDYKEKRENNKLPTLKSIQAIFKPDTVNRILVAYKLFYVGCSRAKDELVVLINQEEISTFEARFKDKMRSVGFKIIPEM